MQLAHLAQHCEAGQIVRLLAEVGGQFHRDWGVVLRAVPFTVDRHRAREVTAVSGGTAGAAR